MFSKGEKVNHLQHGIGTVRAAVDEETLIIRFDHGIEECLTEDVERIKAVEQSINTLHFDSPTEVVLRAQAAAILSVNDNWGVFSKSLIKLLPHQLWVCHRVLRQWPTHYLVADDVGLGKTIEAGLILWPLLSKGLVKRLLILAPAGLVEQWQYRLREMFDIRMTIYIPELDKEKSDYWNTHSLVIASLPTLRKDINGRHDRMLYAQDWDLLIVDEAHHLNSSEDQGGTLGYRFVQRLIEHQKFKSKVFFTGTPHRGKDYAFFALMKLVRPDLFGPDKPVKPQLALLKDVLIRNNKQNVTDMNGQKLFKPVTVYQETYQYSETEAAFYKLLTAFILSGQAYASTLNRSNDQRAVMLVLTSLQKLASSSVSAIKRAIQNRLNNITTIKNDLKLLEQQKENLDRLFAMINDEIDTSLTDELQVLEELIVEHSVKLLLMEDEKPRLEALLTAAHDITSETKFVRLLTVLDERYIDRNVLFFTEYKATQSLLMGMLQQKYGDGCVTFINGDNFAFGVKNQSGELHDIRLSRESAVEKFNLGQVRFIVSTEAGGEGIDLQDNCYSMVHVDLPWNPMRLHQRVGRLNRYGQQFPVEVITIRNPETVESRIWDLLNTKLNNISNALCEVMDAPEDLLQLVLGMTDSKLFTQLFSKGLSQSKESLNSWFDAETKKFGGTDVIQTVKNLVGNSQQFDYQSLDSIPKKDLNDLRPFFENMLTYNKKRIIKTGHGITFITPDTWKVDMGIKLKYDGLVFNRDHKQAQSAEKVIGVGHQVFDLALKQASLLIASLCLLPQIEKPLVLFSIFDRITGIESNIDKTVAGICWGSNVDNSEILFDWQILDILNQQHNLQKFESSLLENNVTTEAMADCLQNSIELLKQNLEKFKLPYKMPEVEVLAICWPNIMVIES
jgi:ERCC4-related helicase